MGLKKFEYHSKNIPFLKRDIALRLVFVLVFFAIFAWQFISLMQNLDSGVNVGMIIATIAVLICSLLFAGISILYCLKSFKILTVVKKTGRCLSSVPILFDTSKKGFLKMYSIITEVLAIVCAIVLLCSLIYSLLEMAYFSSISYYMPVLAIICACGFNSVYHINAEIAIAKNVQEYNSIY